MPPTFMHDALNHDSFMRDRTARRRGWSVLALLALAAGLYLRWYQLDSQVLLDDEWHALHKVIYFTAPQIATRFGFADYSIPLTLFYRFSALHGGLTEWSMHLPMLVCGVLLLVLAPWLLRRELSPATRATWAALLAISPLLVYHSRIARPYAITCLLSFVAIIVFRRWWVGKPGRGGLNAAVYVVSTFLCGWLHPVTLVFTLTPFLFHGVETLIEAVKLRSWRFGLQGLRRLVLLGFVTMAPLAAALLPPLLLNPHDLAGKSGVDSVTAESLYRSALLLFGVRHALPFAALATAALYGLARLWRRHRALTGYFLALGIVALATICAMRPLLIFHPLVLARYMLPFVPVLLLLVAEGVAGFVVHVVRAPAAELALVVGFVALVFTGGPIPAYSQAPNQFMSHLKYQYDYDPLANPYERDAPLTPIPAFYRQLAQQPPGSLTLIEAPWRLESNFNPMPWYQEVHRQNVKIGLVTGVCGERTFGEFGEDSRALRFRQLAHLTAILRGKRYDADYLIMHFAPWSVPPDIEGIEWPDVRACLPRIAAALGPPVYTDEQITVFDLRRREAPR